jgi:hypothetical protein
MVRMWTHEPASRLSSKLFDRFVGRATIDEFPRLSQDRLMEESQRRLADAMASDQPGEERVAARLLQNPRDYHRWEDEHAMLMRRVSIERLPWVQKAQLLNTSLALVHRKAMFEYLRDEQLRGRRREQIVAHFFAQRDYMCAMVSEHGRYVRSAASYLCSSHVGSNVMFDALFETPLAEYEELYASYFRNYCNAVLATDDNVLANTMLPVLVDLKKQISEWRRALIALTHSQSGVWRRPIL